MRIKYTEQRRQVGIIYDLNANELKYMLVRSHIWKFPLTSRF